MSYIRKILRKGFDFKKIRSKRVVDITVFNIPGKLLLSFNPLNEEKRL